MMMCFLSLFSILQNLHRIIIVSWVNCSTFPETQLKNVTVKNRAGGKYEKGLNLYILGQSVLGIWIMNSVNDLVILFNRLC